MIEWILSSSVLIVVVALIRLLLKGRLSLRLQYALWGLVLLRLLIPFSFGSSPISVSNVTSHLKPETSLQSISENKIAPDSSTQGEYVQQDKAPEQVEFPSAPVQQGDGAEESYPNQPQQSHTPDSPNLPVEEPEIQNDELQISDRTEDTTQWLEKAAWGVWIAGMVAVGLCFAGANLIFARRMRRSRVAVEDMSGKLPVFATEALESPCLFGVIRPAIYLNPQALSDHKLMRHSIVHETTHYMHGDHIWAVLRCVCLTVHWYNPLVWLAAFLSKRDAELACDESSIIQLGEQERAEYGQTLISMTCSKKTNKLILSTTMTDSGGGLRERIVLIARKPKMTAYTLLAVILIAAIAVGCTFTGGGELPQATDTEGIAGTTEPTVTTDQPDPTEPPPTDPAPPAYEEYSGPSLDAGTIYDAVDEEQLCIGFVQTETAGSMDQYSYLIPGNQTVMQELLDTALEYRKDANSDNRSKGDDTGWLVLYKGQRFRVYTDGTIAVNYYHDGVILPEHGYLFYSACKAATQEAGLPPVIRPNELTDIRSATLEWNGTHTITDEAALNFLEMRFLNSVYQSGGAACPFDALLTLELGNGRTVQLRMATDECAAWMSEGVAYAFKVLTEDGYKDNTEFYRLFATEVIHELSYGDGDKLWSYMRYMDWARYDAKYGAEKTLALMDRVRTMVQNNPEKYGVNGLLYAANGLDGYMTEGYATVLSQFYAANKKTFAYYCLKESYVENADLIIDMLGYGLGVSSEEIRTELEGFYK